MTTVPPPKINNMTSNLISDQCALDLKNKENMHQFSWMTDSNFTTNTSQCFQKASPFIQSNYKGPLKDLVDTESELFGQNRILTKSCPEKSFPILETDCEKYKNSLPCNCKTCSDIKYKNFLQNCDNFLVPEYTRTNLPCNVLSGININRFDFLCQDPQSVNTIQDNSYIGLNTRLAVRDQFSKT